MWISADESEVVSATLLPKLKKTWRAHEDLLFEAITLQVKQHQASAIRHMYHSTNPFQPEIWPLKRQGKHNWVCYTAQDVAVHLACLHVKCIGFMHMKLEWCRVCTLY